MKFKHGPELLGLGPLWELHEVFSALAEKEGVTLPRPTPPFLEYDDANYEKRDSSASHRGDVSLRTRLTRNIWINKPFVSAPMATVTGTDMAVVLELLGCGAVLRRGFLEPMTKAQRIETQVKEHRATKRQAHLFRIDDPARLTADHPKSKGVALFNEERLGSIILVHNLVGGIFVNIVTPRDLKGSHPMDTPLGEIVRDRKPFVAPPNISREEAKRLLRDVYRVKQLPLVDDVGVCRGLITAQDLDLEDPGSYKYAPDAAWDKRQCNLLGIPSLGLRDKDYVDQAAALYPEHPDAWALEIAHGGLHAAWEAMRYLKRTYPDVDLIAPNTHVPDIAKEHIKYGADALRIGIGPGAECTTQRNVGVGGSQLTAVLRCAEVKDDVPLIADGGVRFGSHAVKALAAGADSVMIGTVFAGTKETPGDEIDRDGVLVKSHFGMASDEAKMLLQNLEEAGLVKEARLGTSPEGREDVIPYRGEVRNIVESFCGWVRSGMTFLGAATIAEMPKRTRFEVRWARLGEPSNDKKD